MKNLKKRSLYNGTQLNEMKGRILIVDDEPELVAALVDGFLKRSYDARGFTNGCAALEAVRVEHFDLLISDLMMPTMDGIALVEAALKLDPQLLAILMTGQATVQSAVEASSVGAVDFVQKPLQMEKLMAIVTRALNQGRSQNESSSIDNTVAATDEPSSQTAS